jgi:hypothetical protein
MGSVHARYLIIGSLPVTEVLKQARYGKDEVEVEVEVKVE